MAKRRRNDDPLASDSDDEDYSDGHRATRRRTTTQPTKKRLVKSSNKKPRASAKPPAKRRHNYKGSDIEDDEEEISEEDSFGETPASSEEEQEVNPRTGRKVRGAVKKEFKYEESSEEDIGDIESNDELSGEVTEEKDSLIITLRVAPMELRKLESRGKSGQPSQKPAVENTRSLRNRSKQPSQTPAPDNTGTRRSTRAASRGVSAPLMELDNTGRRPRTATSTKTPASTSTKTPAPSKTPEPTSRRATRGNKGITKQPSTIAEASQENSNPSRRAEARDSEAADTPPDEIMYERGDANNNGDDDGEDEGQVKITSDVAGAEVVVHDSIERAEENQDEEDEDEEDPVRPARKDRGVKRKRQPEESSDFELEKSASEDNNESDSENDVTSQRASRNPSLPKGRRSGRLTRSQQQRQDESSAEDEIDHEELVEEALELREAGRRHRRERALKTENIIQGSTTRLRNRAGAIDYRIYRPELANVIDDVEDAAPGHTTPRGKKTGGGQWRPLYSTVGPFGGAGGPAPLFGGPQGGATVGDVDSDSSDDEAAVRVGGAPGLTPRANIPTKIKDKTAPADIDPLGVDSDVTFESVGGLDHVLLDLQEMVVHPLLYPELAQSLGQPAKGALFTGPPGTGKTLVARALASQASASGTKVTFYMRKGADVLSKWVGEAERQLRQLFEEARKNQPSIIFFDEIDGLAPVRSSKQEQIHSTIVTTLLALMDGMDNRGQVFIIGATNRPDAVDSALRRPGRFDKEYRFELPTKMARKAILDIHTKVWKTPLSEDLKSHLAENTNEYNGADLKNLCTEAGRNAVKRTYPQIYRTNKKLKIDVSTIKVLPKDFMIALETAKSSKERVTSSSVRPLQKDVESLLQVALDEISDLVKEIIPLRKKLTALEEAEYDDLEDESFSLHNMQLHFDQRSIFRPRLLIQGLQGMGQHYLGDALLARFENLHVQTFDLPTLLADAASPEAVMIQLFREATRSQPSIIYIPDVNTWYTSVSKTVIITLTSMLRKLSPTDPVLVLGTMETATVEERPNPAMLRDLFGFSTKCRYKIKKPDQKARFHFFDSLISYVRKRPAEFPEPENRKKRKLPELPEVIEKKGHEPSAKEQLKEQKKQDHLTLNALKQLIQPVMDQIKRAHRAFRRPAVELKAYQYLLDEQDPNLLTTDLSAEQRQAQNIIRPFELDKDKHGELGIKETATGKFYYNLEIDTIEQRLSNGYYKRPVDFVNDVRKIAKDSRVLGDPVRTIKANELLTNVEVDLNGIEVHNLPLVQQCEAVYVREKQRAAEVAKQAPPPANFSNVPQQSSSTTQTSGPVVLGEKVPGPVTIPPTTPTRAAAQAITNGDSTAADSNSQPNGSKDDEEVGTQEPQEPHGPIQRSQKSAHTQLAYGSQAYEYHNSASTTTSGQKTGSNRSSDRHNTQSTNGAGVPPDFSLMAPGGSSQLPDTQEQEFTTGSSQPTNSQPSQSSQFAVPPLPGPRNATTILNPDPPALAPLFVLDESALALLHQELAARSEGLTVEQLEQVYTAMMNGVQKTRGNWDRNEVIKAVETCFDEALAEIEKMKEEAEEARRLEEEEIL